MIYSHLAGLFEYPGGSFPETARKSSRELKAAYPETAAQLDPFMEAVDTLSLDELQELFVRTFDVQALTSLDIGYVLFGDDYKRGQLLVNLNRELHDAGIDPGGELADHLPNVLRLVDCMEEGETRSDLIHILVFPALVKILSAFDPDRIEKKSKVYEKHHRTVITRSATYGRMYRYPLEAACRVMMRRSGCEIEDEPGTRSDFISSIRTEMELA